MHTSFMLRKEEPVGGSLFGNFTKQTGASRLDTLVSAADEGKTPAAADADAEDAAVTDYRKVDFSKDPEVLAHNYPTPKKAPELLLSDLKQRLYDAAMSSPGGYNKNTPIELDGKKYILHLTKQEQELLEPSVYLRSYRIKGTAKKGTIFTRLLRNMDLKQAINQCHFSPKRISRDVEEMLLRGLDEAKRLDLNPNDLYINQIWVGKEPFTQKRLDCKGRGKTGLIEHKNIHVRVILKTKESRQKFLEAKKERVFGRKVWEQHHNTPIQVYRGSSQYQW
ncbi:hypothetical protein D0Z00_004173 [Geotrichum galactomycetum]|uniref:Uncharacterized protein n=1 Tax=Geotrichum galactomycetum TaxID=27317 RepID=A0ACB6UZG0_9ASCO|nr:hypothetical protein D0Z00_004173 [Geotrichum candidum]